MDSTDFLKDLPPFHSSDEILSQPRFPFARDEFVKAILALYEHKPFLNRLLLEASRTVLVSIIMCLHARYDKADRATWPTLRLISGSMAEHQLASPSRVHDLVSRFVKTGYLEQHAVPQDRRVRIIIPTAKMIAQDQDFLVSHHLPLQILFPDPGYAPIMTRDPGFQLKQRLVSRDLFALGAKILADNPIVMLFQGRDAGVMILIKMIHMAGAQRGAEPLKISYSDLGGRFGVSRTHVLPICFKAGSLGDNVPTRDLWISPHHAMYLDGVLIEAKDLVNGASIAQVEHVDEVEYFHIELDTHDVILAEGALSETFVDDDSRGMFHNAHEYAARYPEQIMQPARYCAPRLEIGYEVEAIRRKLAARAGLSSGERSVGALRGYVDVINPRFIGGWAQTIDAPEAPVCLDIYAGGQLIGQTLANRYRGDLQQAGIGSGRHAFVFTPPEGVTLDPAGVEVRRSLDDTLLTPSRAALHRLAA